MPRPHATPNARRQFASKLRELRLAKGLTQESLGELCGLHRTYVGSVERAERNVSIDNIERLARALDVKIQDLFGAEA
ncbi:MAG: helix-turn-helix transcriptional regulator [Acidobacteria bacterium]|nr:helix-turn-helix transcriptional regulator [Acidobacteriota bacterium]